jgi:hypothetical protein
VSGLELYRFTLPASAAQERGLTLTCQGTSISSPRGLYTVQVLAGGTPQPFYVTPDGYPYIAGEPGQSCQVLIRAAGGGRHLAALAVDGRDAQDDQPADLDRARGLVFTGKCTFSGYRVDNERVREFTFGSVDGSVADQAGSTASVGVIGIAVWRERVLPVTYVNTPTWGSYGFAGPSVTSGTMTPTVSARSLGDTPVAVAAAAGGAPLGMHAGGMRDDHVTSTTFTRDGAPDLLEIGYDTYAALEAMGITRTRPTAWPGRTTGYESYRA